MLKCAFWYRVLHGTEIVRNCYAWDADASKQINTNQQKTADRFRSNDSTCTVMLYAKANEDIIYRLQIEAAGTLSYLKTNKTGQVIRWIQLADLEKS